MLALGRVSRTAPWVLSSGVKGGRVCAVSGPNANIEVQRVASGGVMGGNIKTSFDCFTSAVVGGIPLRDMLFGGDPFVGARAPRGGRPITIPITKVVVASIN